MAVEQGELADTVVTGLRRRALTLAPPNWSVGPWGGSCGECGTSAVAGSRLLAASQSSSANYGEKAKG